MWLSTDQSANLCSLQENLAEPISVKGCIHFILVNYPRHKPVPKATLKPGTCSGLQIIIFLHTKSGFLLLLPIWENSIPYNLYQPVGKKKNGTAASQKTSDIIVMFKLSDDIMLCRISVYSEISWCFFNIFFSKNVVFNSVQERGASMDANRWSSVPIFLSHSKTHNSYNPLCAQYTSN